MNLLAVDLGGSHASCALMSNGELIDSAETAISDNLKLDLALNCIADLFQLLLRRNTIASETCAGIAFSFCGLVDAGSQRILSTNGKYLDFETVDLPAWSLANFNLPLRLENDARTALLGERQAGCARGFDDIVIVTLGTGIGGAAMMEGRLVRGKHSQAGCLGGHFTVNHHGGVCKCGNIGCAEAEASSWSLPQLCASHPKFSCSPLSRQPEVTFAELFYFSSNGDPCAVDVRDHCLRVWGACAVNLIHAYDPELVIFGGGCMKSADQILPAVTQYIHRHAWTPWGRVQVRSAGLGGRAALFGAIPLFEGALQ
jgi:glucokinase